MLSVCPLMQKNFAFSNHVALSHSLRAQNRTLNGSELAVPHPNFFHL